MNQAEIQHEIDTLSIEIERDLEKHEALLKRLRFKSRRLAAFKELQKMNLPKTEFRPIRISMVEPVQ